MGKINSRAKGASAERELIAMLTDELGETLTAPLKRNLEQTRAGGHDIVGLDGWAIEVKRYKRLKEGEIKAFWGQALDQAERIAQRPVLAYREDLCSWRVRIRLSDLVPGTWSDNANSVDWTIEMSVPCFAAVVREQHSATQLHASVTTS